MRKVPYPTPGAILLEEFLKPMGITQYRLANEIGVPQRRIGEIGAGKRAITADRLTPISLLCHVRQILAGPADRSTCRSGKDQLAPVLRKVTPWPQAA
jgi:addiction module HigA family antidote